jgi:hypothetical protein
VNRLLFNYSSYRINALRDRLVASPYRLKIEQSIYYKQRGRHRLGWFILHQPLNQRLRGR